MKEVVKTNKKRLEHSALASLLMIVVCFSLGLQSASAEYIAPDKVEVKTKQYEPLHADFAKGVYHYDVKWQGMPVASAEILVDSEGSERRSSYKVRASAETGGLVKLFYKMKHVSESVFDAESLRPGRFVSMQQEKSKRRVRRVAFDTSGGIRAESEKNGKSNGTLEFRSDNFTLDPISAAFMARSLPIRLGKEVSFDVFNGKHRYLISFKVEAREEIKVAGKYYDTYRVVPAVEKLTDSEGEKRLSSASIWITADARRDIVKLESEVLVGSVKATLTKFEPQANTVSVAAK